MKTNLKILNKEFNIQNLELTTKSGICITSQDSQELLINEFYNLMYNNQTFLIYSNDEYKILDIKKSENDVKITIEISDEMVNLINSIQNKIFSLFSNFFNDNFIAVINSLSINNKTLKIKANKDTLFYDSNNKYLHNNSKNFSKVELNNKIKVGIKPVGPWIIMNSEIAGISWNVEYLKLN